MILEEKTDMVLMRYCDPKSVYTIKEHEKVLDEKGYVWFGKIGLKVSEKKLSEIFVDGQGYILLKNKHEYHLCKCDLFSFDMPTEGYPRYYKQFLDSGSNPFSTWFRIVEIHEIKKPEILNSVVIKSSRAKLTASVCSSMSAFFFVINKEAIEVD